MPKMGCFYNSLTNECISLSDYNKSCEIFKKLKFSNLKEYMEAYCLIDTYLLAEVFSQFRVQTLSNFGMIHAITSVYLGWAWIVFSKKRCRSGWSLFR